MAHRDTPAQPDGEKPFSEMIREQEEETRRKEALRRRDAPTLGEVIDGLGADLPPGDRGYATACKALVITTGPSPRLAGVMQLGHILVGGLSPVEALGLLEMVKSEILNPARQQEGLRRLLEA